MKQSNIVLFAIFLIAMSFSLGCKKSQVTDKDGNVYKTVTIGEQEWTAENLNVEHYRNGDVIPQVQDYDTWYHLTTGAWCYYGNNAWNGKIYGKLYNWYAVNDPRGLAPEGWHVPSDAEWTKLTDYLDGDEVAGGRLKATKLWDSPNTDATNEFGFTALPGGIYGHWGPFSFIGQVCSFWSSSESKNPFAWVFKLRYDDSDVILGTNDKLIGMSVRCVKD